VPNTYQELFREAIASGHRVTPDGSGALITVRAAAGCVVEIMMPGGIHEWFFTVRSADGAEIYNNWDDAFRTSDETPEELTAMLSAAAARLMRAVAAAELRVVPRPGIRFLGREWLKGQTLEIAVAGAWQDWEQVLYPDGAVEQQLAELRQRAAKGAG